MKVLLINELYISGGAEMQTMRERDILKGFGDEALVITLDPDYEDGWCDVSHYNISRRDSRLRRELQMYFADRDITGRLRRIIEDFSPDHIHLGNVKAHALSVFRAVRGYHCVRTIRDYGAVCPLSLCVCSDLSVCSGYEGKKKCGRKCIGREKGVKKKIVDLWKRKCFLRRDKVQRRTVSKYICPSQLLTDYCIRYGMDTVCINNPFDFSLLEDVDKKTPEGKKIFLYYGQIIGFKGVGQLMEAFAEFSAHRPDTELHMAGMLPDKYKEEFEELLRKYGSGRIKYLGRLGYKEMINKLREVYTVVIPSVWMENYPNTALEAMAAKCLVLASERGGMREMTGSGEFIFNVLDKKSIISRLEYAYEMEKPEYERITGEGFLRVRENNSFGNYYRQLVSCLEGTGKKEV